MADGTSWDAAGAPNLRPAAPVGDRTDVRAAVPSPSDRQRAELATLFDTHGIKVKAYFRRSGVGDAQAEDLTQETFARALRALGAFRGDAKLSTWLWTIAQNLLLEHRRRPSLLRAEHDGEPVDVDSLSAPADPHHMDRDDCVRRGFEAFSRDHPERAQVIFLALVEEFTRDELAAFLGRSTHAATEYLSQCKAKFKAYIGHCHDE
jgi:RNA polymerase sigma-70 factor, ECF subfamily